MSEEKEKILLVQDGGRAKETKWSLRRYLTETWHYKWWVLGASALIAIAGALAIEFAYNRSTRTISSSFSLEVPAQKSLMAGLTVQHLFCMVATP